VATTTVPAPKPAVRAAHAINYRWVAGAGAASIVLIVGLVAASVVLVQRSRRAPELPPIAEAPPVEVEVELTIAPEEPVHMPATVSSGVSCLSPAAPPLEIKQPPTVKEVLRRQRAQRSDEDLRKQLLAVPEVRLDSDKSRKNTREIIDRAQLNANRSNLRPDQVHFTPDLLNARADLMGLPWRRGADCQLGKEPAEHLQHFSRKLRAALQQAKAKNGPEDVPEAVRNSITEMTRFLVTKDSHTIDLAEAAIPTLMQMLCAENKAVRLVMIEHLAQIDHRAASEALAKMAIFDLSEKVRAEALRVLSQRSKQEARTVLLEGLRYPWGPVADHAAEALVILQDREAVPALKQMMNAPDPKTAYFDWSDRSYFVREVVRVNHLANCVMCHAPSSNTGDLVRGKVPTPGEPLPVEYYENPNGIFVRADVTYLKQDFSVIQPVDSPSQWPVMQRFDYVVRKRPATSDEMKQVRSDTKSADYPQREAVQFALRVLEADAKAARREEAALDRP
jgi:hypothetical protein